MMREDEAASRPPVGSRRTGRAGPANRKLVNGNYSGTTNQIIQWARKWGMGEDLLRAVAVQESNWHQSTVGENFRAEGPLCQTSSRAVAPPLVSAMGG
jgi:hypothetical protein